MCENARVSIEHQQDGYLSLGHYFLNTNSAEGRGKSVRDLGGFRVKEILPQDEVIHPIEIT